MASDNPKMYIEVHAKATTSYDNMQKEITALVEKLDQPITLKFDASGLSGVKELKAQIDAMYASFKGTGTASFSSGVTSASQAAKSASTSIGELAKRTSEYQKQSQTASSMTSTYRNALSGTTTTIRQVADSSGNLQTATTRVTESFKTSAAAAKEAATAEKEAAAEEERRVTAAKKYNTVLQQLKNALDKYSKAENSLKASSREAYQAIKAEYEAMLQGKSAVDSYAKASKETNAATAAASKTLAANTQVIKANNDATKSAIERVGGLASKFGTWLGVSQIIMYAVNSVRKMITASIELDTAMTELKKVTNETDATYTKFLDNASERAKTLGASLSDVVSATADFARLGYDIDDASTLADAATIYLNVGDDLDSIDDASESIISTMQAFGIEANDVLSIVDKLNEVSNNYAISSGGLGEALQRSAAAMAAANNTLDETVALITAANTIVQDSDSVGRCA